MRRAVSSLVALSLLVACQSATDAESKLVLTMTTDRTSLSVGDTAHLTLTLTNRLPIPVRVPTPWCGPFFSVSDAGGRPSGPPRLICDLILVAPTVLASGQSLTLHDSWAADSGSGSGFHTLRVDPGSYILRGLLEGPEHPITSNTVEIRVQGSN
jgi:hypothetical protein